jgi:hypothetical protein
MTQAKAAETAAALVNFGYFPVVAIRNDGEYMVTANELTPGAGISLDDGKAFQDLEGLTGRAPAMTFA